MTRESVMTDAVGVPPIRLELVTGADPELAWRTLTEPDRVVLWLTDAVDVGRVGDAYLLDFGDGSLVRGRILAVEPGRSFSHTWAWEDAEATEVTTVTWTLEPMLGGTRIRLQHDGWAEAGLDGSARADHERYWAGYLDDLRDVLEEA